MNFRDLIHHYNGEPLNEVAFSEKNIDKVVKLYSKIMGKRMGGEFKPLGYETYKRKWGTGKGLRTINKSGEMLRFNWDTKFAKKSQYDLTSIDYWAPNNTDFEQPTRTVKLGSNLNVVMVLSKIIKALHTGTINEARETINDANTLCEKRSVKEKKAWMTDKGLPSSYFMDDRMRKSVSKKAPHLAEELEIFLGSTETNSFEGDIKKVEKQFDKTVYADPDTVFDDIEDLLSLVATGAWRTLIVCGMGGIGKTYHITEGDRSLPELLGPEGDKWTYHSGTKASPLSFYKTLFQERDKVIVFDEADALLKHSEIIMMLKPILDTSGNNLAEYITGTANMVGKSKAEVEEYAQYVDAELADGKIIGKKDTDLTVALPSKFQFTGGMIFISNMKSDEIEQAIMSRSIFIDIHLAESDVLKRIKSIGYAQAKGRGESTDEIDEVLEALGEDGNGPDVEITYMTPEYARKNKQLTVRAMTLALILKKSGLPNWARLSALYA